MALEKALFFDPDEKPFRMICVQFNPESLEYSYGKKNPSRQKKGKSQWGQRHQQQSPLDPWNSSTLSMRLFFNGYTNESTYVDVREMIKDLRMFLCKTEKEQEVNNRRIQFAWGTFAFEGYLDALQVTYQMFGADGTPVRAEASVTISGEESDITPELRKLQLQWGGLPATGRVETMQMFGWLFL